MNCKYDVIIILDCISWIKSDYNAMSQLHNDPTQTIKFLAVEAGKMNKISCKDAEMKNHLSSKIKELNSLASQKKVSFIGKLDDADVEPRLLDVLLKNYSLKNILLLTESDTSYPKLRLFVPIFEKFGKILNVSNAANAGCPFQKKEEVVVNEVTPTTAPAPQPVVEETKPVEPVAEEPKPVVQPVVEGEKPVQPVEEPKPVEVKKEEPTVMVTKGEKDPFGPSDDFDQGSDVEKEPVKPEVVKTDVKETVVTKEENASSLEDDFGF